MLLGHVKDDAVLLARVAHEFVAVSARCTHYGGPLADGVIDRRHRALPVAPRLFQRADGRSARERRRSVPLACWKVVHRGENRPSLPTRSSAIRSRRAIPPRS